MEQAELLEINFPHQAVEVSTGQVELLLYTSEVKIPVDPKMIADLKRAIASGEVKTMFLNSNVLDNYEEPTGNEPEVVVIDHQPPAENTRGRSGVPLSVSRHVDVAVYGIRPPRHLKDEYVSARSHSAVFNRIDNRPRNPIVDEAVGRWLTEFDRHKTYNKREVLFRCLLKGNKGRARDRCGCVQEALYRIQVTHRKLFTPDIIQAARQVAKGYNYAKHTDPFSEANGWLGL